MFDQALTCWGFDLLRRLRRATRVPADYQTPTRHYWLQLTLPELMLCTAPPFRVCLQRKMMTRTRTRLQPETKERRRAGRPSGLCAPHRRPQVGAGCKSGQGCRVSGLLRKPNKVGVRWCGAVACQPPCLPCRACCVRSWMERLAGTGSPPCLHPTG